MFALVAGLSVHSLSLACVLRVAGFKVRPSLVFLHILFTACSLQVAVLDLSSVRACVGPVIGSSATVALLQAAGVYHDVLPQCVLMFLFLFVHSSLVLPLCLRTSVFIHCWCCCFWLCCLVLVVVCGCRCLSNGDLCLFNGRLTCAITDGCIY